ncbi:hypothetical protein ACFWWT_26365 [Streptomyces sp. NPDC058676]|uniref:hypothetical protein n=1 Tax=unclassified Streptomyces TaxID=2593676 RepID=UPI0036550ED5
MQTTQTIRKQVDGRLWRWCAPVGLLVNTYGYNLFSKTGENKAFGLLVLGLAMAFVGARWWKREVFMARWWHDSEKVKTFLWAAVPSAVILTYLNRPEIWQSPEDGRLTYSMLRWALLATWLAMAAGSQERDPKDFPIEKLPTRIKCATRDRIRSNLAGLGVAVVLISEQFFDTYKAPVISTTLTLAAGSIVLLHKTHTRVRKLCTQTHTDVQALLRDLDDLAKAKGDDIGKKADPALRSWDALHLDLRAGIDTGYPVGMPFLPASTLQALETKILAAIRCDPVTPDAIDAAGEELRALQAACADRLDPLA